VFSGALETPAGGVETPAGGLETPAGRFFLATEAAPFRPKVNPKIPLQPVDVRVPASLGAPLDINPPIFPIWEASPRARFPPVNTLREIFNRRERLEKDFLVEAFAR